MAPNRTRPDDGVDDELIAVEALLERIVVPVGWRLLRTAGRLEARWRDGSGAWARLSIRLSAEPAAQSGLCSCVAPVGGAQLSLEFDGAPRPAAILAAAELLDSLSAVPAVPH